MTEPRVRGRPFVKGQSGNPAGRAPNGQTFAEVLKAQLADVKAGTTTRERVVSVAVALALKGNLEAIKWIVDRVDGRSPERLDVDARVAPRLDEDTRIAILADAARRRALARDAG